MTEKDYDNYCDLEEIYSNLLDKYEDRLAETSEHVIEGLDPVTNTEEEKEHLQRLAASYAFLDTYYEDLVKTTREEYNRVAEITRTYGHKYNKVS